MKRKSLFAGLLAAASMNVGAQTAPTVPQFVTPEQFRAMSHGDRRSYVAGAVDADRMLFPQTRPSLACLDQYSLDQITDIVDRGFGTLTPELRSNTPMEAHNALVYACNGGVRPEPKLSTDTLLGIWSLVAGVVGVVFGVLGFVVAYLSITSDGVRRKLLRWKAKGFPKTFQELSKEYRRAERIAKEDDRVRRKDDIALAMAYFSLGAGLSREAMASLPDEGYLAALAKLVQISPERKDGPLIVKSASVDSPPHARYQVMSAIRTLSEMQCLPEDLQPIRDMLRRFRDDMGPDHHKQIDDLLGFIRKGQTA